VTEQIPAGRRQAIVIGGSDGIGLAVTRRLLAQGWRVAGLSRSASPVEHRDYRHDQIDVTSIEYPQVLERVVEHLGRIDLCVYSVGTGQTTGVADLPGQTHTMQVNLIGAGRTVEVVLPRMIKAGGGHLIGLSSLGDVLFDGDAFGYLASKAGLSTYLYGLALAVRRFGIDVTNVRFGLVDTKMGQSPVRPMLISADQAAAVVVGCVRRRSPRIVSYPRRMAVLVRLLRLGQVVRLRLPDPRGQRRAARARSAPATPTD